MKIKIYTFRGLLCVLSTVVLAGCNQASKQENSGEGKLEVTQTEVTSSYQKKMIDKDLMLKLDSTYSANNYRYINEKRSKNNPDSREFWYTLEDLEGYIAFAKKVSGGRLPPSDHFTMVLTPSAVPISATSAPRLANNPTVTTPGRPLMAFSSATASRISRPCTSRITLPLSVTTP